MQFTVLFLAGAIATFPLFVPPFFLPLYASSLGLSASAGAGLVAGFNFSSAVGRLCCGLLSDFMGPVNTLLLSLVLSAMSMLVLWPVSNSLGPLILFVIVNGAANGGFFSTMPTVVGSVFGSRRVGVAMGMIVSGWAGGYLMVSTNPTLLEEFVRCAYWLTRIGCSHCWISPRGLWRRTQHAESVPSRNILCWFDGGWCCYTRWCGEDDAQQKSLEEVVDCVGEYVARFASWDVLNI
jgi:MFS family permease